MPTKSYYHAILAYDGTNYLGWQTTKMGPSIQETLTQAIQSTTQEKTQPEASSRTDKGVHARGQSVCFSLIKSWDPSRLIRAINAHLPLDIRITHLLSCAPNFHPTLDAKAKEYHFVLSMEPFQKPQDRFFAWHIPYPLNLELMKEAAKIMEGIHDFSAFSTEKAKNPICEIFSIRFLTESDKLTIQMKGDRFIYKMARTIAGTLVYVGKGKLTCADVLALFSEKFRKNAGITAPPHGLFLDSVIY